MKAISSFFFFTSFYSAIYFQPLSYLPVGIKFTPAEAKIIQRRHESNINYNYAEKKRAIIVSSLTTDVTGFHCCCLDSRFKRLTFISAHSNTTITTTAIETQNIEKKNFIQIIFNVTERNWDIMDIVSQVLRCTVTLRPYLVVGLIISIFKLKNSFFHVSK